MSRRHALIAAGFFTLALVAGGLVPESIRESLRWSREVPTIEWLWRSWCAHWLHLDLAHALVNAAGFLLVWVWLATSFTAVGWVVVAVIGIASIDLGLWWLTSFDWYVGASALIHSVAAAGITARVLDGDRFARWIALAGVLKLLLEQAFTPGSLTTGAMIATDAHLIGAVAGFLCGSVFASTGWCRSRSVAIS